MTATTDSSTPAPDAAGARRDGFLDAIRAVAIIRVVVVHALHPLGWLWWPAPLWVIPGMPLVFFCSGALMWSSLDRRPDDMWSVVHGRLRRLVVPSLVFLGALIAGSIALSTLVGDARYQVTIQGWYRWLVWDIPAPSQAVREHDGHLWFVGTFIILLALSPILHQLHRRHLALPLALACAATVELVVRTPGDALNRLAMYAPFFCAGFYYGDGTVLRLRKRFGAAPLIVAALLLAALGAALFTVDQRDPNATVGAALTVAGAWALLLLACRPGISALSQRWNRGVRWVSNRTLAIYLVGWPASQAAERTADAIIGRDNVGTLPWSAVFLGLTAVLLLSGVVLLYPVEQLARRPVREWAPFANSAVSARS